MKRISDCMIGRMDDLYKEVVAYLQDLLREQDRRKRRFIRSDFDITEYINHVEMPPYSELISSDKVLCRLASKLFACDENDVSLAKKRLSLTKNCSEINFYIGETIKTFYVKRAWEGSIKEALGLEMNNFLSDTPQRYLCNHEIVITERMYEPLYPETVYHLRELPEYIFAYGAWEIFTTILKLTDRKISNVRWNGNRLANIDFGLVFYRGEPFFDSRLAVSCEDEIYHKGRTYALQFILNRLSCDRDKIEMLLLNVDSIFCRDLKCRRVPAVPLKTILEGLEKIGSQNVSLFNY